MTAPTLPEGSDSQQAPSRYTPSKWRTSDEKARLAADYEALEPTFTQTEILAARSRPPLPTPPPLKVAALGPEGAAREAKRARQRRWYHNGNQWEPRSVKARPR